MIDIENYVFTALMDAVTAEYPDAEFHNDYDEELAGFPAVTVMEINNTTLRRMQDDALTEHYATITYEVNVYSNERLNKKAVCKDIIRIVDGVMLGMKFSKGPCRNVPAVDHSRSVYRMYARYTGVVDEGEEDENGNIVYHTYRG